MTRQQRRADGERGAILIHVAFGLLAITALSTFVIDYGLYWTSRRQIQNAADAGALAGAIALAFDSKNVTPTGPAARSAVRTATSNLVWGQGPDVNPNTDVIFNGSALGLGPCPAPNVDGACVRVDAYRTLARSNPLPTFFGGLAGLTSQNVQATATAQVLAANASNCIKPIAVADKWIENNPVIGAPWTPTSTFNPTGGNPDVYVPPSPSGPGSGFTVAADYGTELLLKPGRPGDAINPGWFQPVRFPGSSGGNDYRQALANCTSGNFEIGDFLDKENGNMIGPTSQGIGDLLAKDPGARWNYSTQKVENSCWETNTCSGNPGAKQSPRIVALPVFDLGLYMSTGGTGNGGNFNGAGSVKIVNILGFFVLDMVGNDVRGILMTAPGLFNAGGGTISNESAFLNTIMLVR